MSNGSLSWSMDSKAALTRLESKIFGVNVSIQNASFQPAIFFSFSFDNMLQISCVQIMILICSSQPGLRCCKDFVHAVHNWMQIHNWKQKHPIHMLMLKCKGFDNLISGWIFHFPKLRIHWCTSIVQMGIIYFLPNILNISDILSCWYRISWIKNLQKEGKSMQIVCRNMFLLKGMNKLLIFYTLQFKIGQ